MSNHIVKVLTASELRELQKVYEKYIPYASHVNSLLLTYFKWKNSHPEKEYLTFLALKDHWKKSGTFLMKFRTFDIFVFTLDETGEDLYSLLKESKALKVEPQPWATVIYGIRNDHFSVVRKSLKDLEIPIKNTGTYKFYWLSKEEALKYSIDCPDDVYIGKLDLSHIDLICSLWPNAYPGCEDYLSTYVEMNGCYGVFLKQNHQLVSWIIQNHWGTLVVLETVPEYKRKGYGSLITKKTCIEIAKEGINPLCTISFENNISEALFKKLGFKRIGDCTFATY